jgi:hypothetical protein
MSKINFANTMVAQTSLSKTPKEKRKQNSATFTKRQIWSMSKVKFANTMDAQTNLNKTPNINR